jgi:hypothetical protein
MIKARNDCDGSASGLFEAPAEVAPACAATRQRSAESPAGPVAGPSREHNPKSGETFSERFYMIVQQHAAGGPVSAAGGASPPRPGTAPTRWEAPRAQGRSFPRKCTMTGRFALSFSSMLLQPKSVRCLYRFLHSIGHCSTCQTLFKLSRCIRMLLENQNTELHVLCLNPQVGALKCLSCDL